MGVVQSARLQPHRAWRPTTCRVQAVAQLAPPADVARCVAASQVRYHSASRAKPLKRRSVGRRNMRPYWVAIILIGSGLGLQADPEISSVRFETCSSPRKCTAVSRWSERQHTSANEVLKVVCSIANASSLDDEYFLLTTTDYLIAPVFAYSINDFERLRSGNEVSFGQLTQDNDMRTFVLHRLQRGTKREVVLRELDVRQLLRLTHSDPEDSMWPWLVRVNARLVDRQGRTVSSQAGLLEVAPRPERPRTGTAK